MLLHLQDNYVRPHALSSFLHTRGVSDIHSTYDRHDTAAEKVPNYVQVQQDRRAESFVGCGVKVCCSYQCHTHATMNSAMHFSILARISRRTNLALRSAETYRSFAGEQIAF